MITTMEWRKMSRTGVLENRIYFNYFVVSLNDIPLFCIDSPCLIILVNVMLWTAFEIFEISAMLWMVWFDENSFFGILCLCDTSTGIHARSDYTRLHVIRRSSTRLDVEPDVEYDIPTGDMAAAWRPPTELVPFGLKENAALFFFVATLSTLLVTM